MTIANLARAIDDRSCTHRWCGSRKRFRLLRWILRPLFEIALARAVRERGLEVESLRRAGVV
jgi:hypothetical protein